MTGTRDKNPKFVVSTGNKLYLYTKTDQADSRRGYRIRYYEGNVGIDIIQFFIYLNRFKSKLHFVTCFLNDIPGCNVVINQFNGTLTSPAFGKSEIDGYPPNQECIYSIRNPSGTRLSMMFTSLDVHNSDKVQVRDFFRKLNFIAKLVKLYNREIICQH